MNVREITYHLIAAMAPDPPARLTDELQLTTDLGYDSLRTLELMIALESRLALPDIDPARAATASTVGAVVDLVDRIRTESGLGDRP